jgi:hypothetical protein
VVFGPQHSGTHAFTPIANLYSSAPVKVRQSVCLRPIAAIAVCQTPRTRLGACASSENRATRRIFADICTSAVTFTNRKHGVQSARGTHYHHQEHTADTYAVSLVTPVTSAAPLVLSAHTTARRGMHNPIAMNAIHERKFLTSKQSFREGPSARQHQNWPQAHSPRPHPWW